jgi:hypothetical protein
MKLEDWMYYDACRHLTFDDDTTPFHSIEIWAYEVYLDAGVTRPTNHYNRLVCQISGRSYYDEGSFSTGLLRHELSRTYLEDPTQR